MSCMLCSNTIHLIIFVLTIVLYLSVAPKEIMDDLGISPTRNELKDIALQTPHSTSSVRMTTATRAEMHQVIKKQHPPQYVVLDMTVSQ